MRARLRPVQHYFSALLMRFFDDIFYRIDSAESVGYMNQRDYFDPRAQHFVEFLQDYLSLGIDGDYFKRCFFFLAKHLPGNNIGMVFHGRDDYFISLAYEFPAIGIGDQVNAFRGSLGKYNFLRLPSINKL